MTGGVQYGFYDFSSGRACDLCQGEKTQKTQIKLDENSYAGGQSGGLAAFFICGSR